MNNFSIPRITADRLARLVLACASGTPQGVLHHIGVRLGNQAVRFSATNGQILASLVIPLDDHDGGPLDLVLDAEQFTAALKATAKGTAGRIQFHIAAREARLINGGTEAVVRRIDGAFPMVDHVWTRTAGKRWVPAVSSLSPALLVIAQKIAGNKQALLFCSPVDPASGLERLWGSTGKPDDAISLAGMRAAITAPAFWADHELAVLIMPVSRGDAERQLDLSAHALSNTTTAAVAA